MKRSPLQRKTPMRRTPFVNDQGKRVYQTSFGGKVKLIAAPMPADLHFRANRAVMTRIDNGNMPEARPKRTYVRSPALLAAVPKLLYCCLGQHSALPMACHSNWQVHGKGKGIKADDNRIAAGCLECHHELDQGKEFDEDEKKLWWWAAHVETVRRLINHGLWPSGVPVPDTSSSPFVDAVQ